MSDPMNTNTWHTHHDDYLSTKAVDRDCADCYASWTKSSDGLSAHMVHEADCAWVAFLWEQDQGREFIEWMHGEEEDLGAMLFHYDKWAAALRLRTEYLGEWCPQHARTVLVLEEGSNRGFAGEGVSWANLACGHQHTEVGEVDLASL